MSLLLSGSMAQALDSFILLSQSGNKAETKWKQSGNKVETKQKQSGNKVETIVENTSGNQSGNKVETMVENNGWGVRCRWQKIKDSRSEKRCPDTICHRRLFYEWGGAHHGTARQPPATG